MLGTKTGIGKMFDGKMNSSKRARQRHYLAVGCAELRANVAQFLKSNLGREFVALAAEFVSARGDVHKLNWKEIKTRRAHPLNGRASARYASFGTTRTSRTTRPCAARALRSTSRPPACRSASVPSRRMRTSARGRCGEARQARAGVRSAGYSCARRGHGSSGRGGRARSERDVVSE
jgi:hypothetical protein